MKLASYKDGSRDGQLVVVSRDLSQAVYASQTANRLQQVLDDWNFFSPTLQDLYDALNAGRARHAFAFDPAQCMAPLPRAYQCVRTAGWPSHGELLRQSGLAAEGSLGPAFEQRAGDALLGPLDAVPGAGPGQVLDFAAGVALFTGDIAHHSAPERALEGVRLLALCNALSLRPLAGSPAGLADAVATAFSPVAITSDELGPAWSRGRLQLALLCSWNGRKVGSTEVGADMGLHFGQLLALLAKSRPLRAGSILVGAPVSNAGVQKGSQQSWPQGFNSIIEKRAMETLQDGQAATEYLREGDTVRLDMQDATGRSLFGAMELEVQALDAGA